MKVTETRKQIIELIEPFMDKTLSEGCLLKIFNRDELDKVIYDESYDINDDDDIYVPTFYGYAIEAKYKLEGHEKDDGVIRKIIGHYDITVVIKYISRFYNDIQEGLNPSILTFISPEGIYIGGIPNKPLNLYSEEEDENLLTLLQQLGTPTAVTNQ